MHEKQFLLALNDIDVYPPGDQQHVQARHQLESQTDERLVRNAAPPVRRSFQQIDFLRRGHARKWIALIFVLHAVCQTGCLVVNQFRSQPTVPAPTAFIEIPSKEQILAHLSTQTEQVRQLQTDVRVSMDGLPTLRGTLAVEKPDRMRLNAGLLGVSELGVDVGSNQDVFWFWAKVAVPGEEPGIFFAKHEEYRQCELRQAIPIEPSWLIEALGLVSFESDDRIEGPFQRPDGRIELHSYRTVGNQSTFRKTAIDPKYGWVVQQAIYDGAGRIIAYADSIKYEYYPEHNVNLPSRIEITAFDPNQNPLKLIIDTSRFRINSIYGDPEKLWTMPSPGDVRLIDLAKTASDSNTINTGVGKLPDTRQTDHRTSSSQRNQSQTVGGQLR